MRTVYLHHCSMQTCIVDDLYPTHTRPVVLVHMSREHMVLLCIVGTVDGRGYNDQLKHTICDTCRQCHLIRSILKPVFGQLRQIGCIYESLRCLDLKIWLFCGRRQQQQQQHNQIFISYACTWSKNLVVYFRCTCTVNKRTCLLNTYFLISTYFLPVLK